MKRLCARVKAKAVEMNSIEWGQRSARLGQWSLRRAAVKSAQHNRQAYHALDMLMKLVCREYQLTESDLASAGRERLTSEAQCVIGWLAQKSGRVTLAEVGKYFGRGVTTLSRGVQRLGLKAKTSKVLEKRLADFNNAIAQA